MQKDISDNMGRQHGHRFNVYGGPWDDATKTIHLKGKTTDPATGKEMNVRQTVKFIDDNTQQIEMFSTENGTEFKMMGY